METITFKFVGTAPVILHNGQLADPLNSHAKALKALSGKRKKTDDDYAALADAEWLGGLYTNADGRVVLTGDMLEAALVQASKKQRSGPQAKAGLFVTNDSILEYTGPKSIDALKKDPNFRIVKGVKVTTSRVMRCRPIFRDWWGEVLVHFNPEVLNRSQVIEFAEIAGEVIGIGDWRPRYGRFTTQEL